ncbi:type II toxin-antitoxin system YafQ family toxin [Acetobacteraceae bacterium]|nr:type II toxin-antitoxin system YafQ family toxin [Acetobacteraceae bacterium]
MGEYLLTVVPSNEILADLKKAKYDQRNLSKFKTTVNLLAKGIKLPRSYRDHDLKGKWIGFRELHIDPDWLLIYWIDGEKLRLIRLGTHDELFT